MSDHSSHPSCGAAPRSSRIAQAVCMALALGAVAGAVQAQQDGGPPPLANAPVGPDTPYSFGVSQSLVHDSNLFRVSDGDEEDEWLSTTALNFALDQPIGRQRLKGSAALQMNRYREHDELNNTGHQLGLELDWETIGNLSGVLGAQSARHQYRFGLDSGAPSTGRNIESTQSAFAQAKLGGMGLWALQAGFNALRRDYSAETFDALNKLSQWGIDGGIAYRPSPDLTALLALRYTRISRPNAELDTGLVYGDDVGRKGAELGVMWQASGASRFDMRVTRYQEKHSVEVDREFWTGGVAWDWVPSAKLRFRTQLLRDTEGGSGNVASPEATMPAAPAGDQLRDAFIWTGQWSATAKINVVAMAQWSRRRLGVTLGDTELQDRTTALSFGLRYAPARWLDFGCDLSSERRDTNTADVTVTRPYDAMSAGCMLQLWLR